MKYIRTKKGSAAGKASRRGRTWSFLRPVCLFLALSLLLPLSGCGSDSDAGWAYQPITDVNDLEGRRVGVNMAFESDYILTGRSDMVLYRYDTLADMILALSYGKIDVIAVDEMYWRVIDARSDGLAAVDPPFAETGYLLYFSPGRRELMEEFNAFLAEYKQTEDYRDFLEREAAFDGEEYVGPEIPLTGTGPVIRVAAFAEEFPRCYYDPGGTEPKGYDLEAVKRFANARGYQLEFSPSTYDDATMGLKSGVYDIAVGYISDAYREEALAAGYYTSDTMDLTPLYFIQKTQRKISADLDELE